MRFECSFLNQDTDGRLTIVTALSAEECRSVARLRKCEGTDIADVTAEAMALRHAYAEVPRGFLHVERPSQIHLS